MRPSGSGPSRRQALLLLPALSCAGCGGGAAAEGTWVPIPLAQVPALAEPGGVAAYRDEGALLDVLLLHPSQGRYLALWRLCTHGACAVEHRAAERDLLCPCHRSRFAEDGAVLVGPATRPLRAFPVERRGDVLYLRRDPSPHR